LTKLHSIIEHLPPSNNTNDTTNNRTPSTTHPYATVNVAFALKSPLLAPTQTVNSPSSTSYTILRSQTHDHH
jgi:hypothetical protein